MSQDVERQNEAAPTGEEPEANNDSAATSDDEVKEMTIEVTIGARSPLLMQAMPMWVIIESLIHKKTSPSKPDEPLEDKAERCLYLENRDAEESPIVIPTRNVFACLREAGRFVKYEGKRMISSAGSTMLPSFYTAQDERVPLLVKGEPAIHRRRDMKNPKGRSWELDVDWGRGQTGSAVGIIRPKFRDWSFKMRFDLMLEPPITEATMRRLFDIAGNRIGLCAYRPEKNGTFGRFRVTDWKTIPRSAE